MVFYNRLIDQLRRVPHVRWRLPPGFFSSGERQRVNIARSFFSRHPVFLIDEPKASLDAASRRTVVDLIDETKRDGRYTRHIP